MYCYLALFVMILFFGTNGVFGQMPLPGAEQVGVAAAVRGGVELARGGAVGHVVESGESVYLEDAVTTDAKGALQILLLDETAFTIGPNSAIVINRFVYDPATGDGKVDARIVKGTFRFITGKIARKKPEDMTIALPAGTIGIRGTMAMGNVKGERSLVVLTGPGKQNTTGNKRGELVVSNEEGNEKKTVNLTKTGYGTVIEGAGKGPSDPFEVPEAQLAEMTQSLSPEGEGAGEEGVEDSESATEQAGQDQVDAVEDVSGTESTGEVTQSLSEESVNATQTANNSLSVQDGITTVQQLLSITTGQFHFDKDGITLFNSGGGSMGSFDFTYNIDFGARIAGGGNSKITGNAENINSDNEFQFNLAPVNFSDGEGGLAVHTYSNIPNTTVTTSCSTCFADVIVTAKNSGGVIAANGDVFATVRQSSVTDTGSGNAPLTAGLSQ